MMETPVASIDLGTNSARLLIGVDDSQRGIRTIALRRAITRLGGGFSRETGLSAEARERTLAVLRDFANEINRYHVSRVRAVATSAVRDASNGKDFADEVFRETGIRLEIIDGHIEALLNLQGVSCGLGTVGDMFVFDIGGGSTEYVMALGARPIFSRSLPLGVVRLTEGKEDVFAMGDKIDRELRRLYADITAVDLAEFIGGASLVGTAGTLTTLAMIDRKTQVLDSRQVHGCSLSLESIRAIYETLLSKTPAERLRIPGLEKGREDLIIAGTLITIRTMELFGFTTCIVCDTGILEGLVYEMLTGSGATGHEDTCTREEIIRKPGSRQ